MRIIPAVTVNGDKAVVPQKLVQLLLSEDKCAYCLRSIRSALSEQAALYTDEVPFLPRSIVKPGAEILRHRAHLPLPFGIYCPVHVIGVKTQKSRDRPNDDSRQYKRDDKCLTPDYRLCVPVILRFHTKSLRISGDVKKSDIR